jgi:transcription-repair coupling factor (superfamily II helicase)
MEHGIGRFEGMTQKIVDELPREYLEISYADNDKLFVPVDQADKLSKFVHEEGEEPRLTRLGSNEWKRVTKKISEEAEKVARELLDIYAKRAKAKGFRYSDDDDVMRKFEEAFPYQETPGQVRAIEDIKNDMESDHPMDRLVCGDVGFGKTEVAMRAAFKAVRDGKQVAFVSPITILANQHYQNMLERTKGFPCRIEMISRFRSAAEQKIILEKLRKGDIDVIVGTHRLLQDDVKFLNLGLVIIDEEQRFGVKQKEKLKSMRASVDILTMTATPIPRTLNLGLHKLRDITTITTPPPGRLPIITEVRKYSDALVRQAIKAELDRGGQVYMLHNRVETIEAFAMKLRALVPDATFVVTHGQLKSELLEERIEQFKEGKFDVLVSSTIIENGIDLPRANTLIVNEAEHFGLSQLYQLRGRVGRGKTQAYAYFLYHSQRLKDDAKKRLRAIVEASELGSGFQIAMRDLEIRGAGEILGASQSGTMQTVGVSHYLRLLKQAVQNLQSGEESSIEEGMNVEILLPVEALIPSYFIPDEEEKISVYQKLAGSDDDVILEEFAHDLHEEYGELPKQVKNLFAILRLKLASRAAGVTRIKMETSEKNHRDIVLSLASHVSAKEIMQLVAAYPQWRISGATLRVNADEIMKGDETHWVAILTEHIKKLSKRKLQKASKE